MKFLNTAWTDAAAISEIQPLKNMWKYTRIELCHTPPSLGGGSGRRVTVCFSRSPKLAQSLRGVIARDDHSGDTECPQIVDHLLERDGVLVRSWWD